AAFDEPLEGGGDCVEEPLKMFDDEVDERLAPLADRKLPVGEVLRNRIHRSLPAGRGATPGRADVPPPALWGALVRATILFQSSLHGRQSIVAVEGLDALEPW